MMLSLALEEFFLTRFFLLQQTAAFIKIIKKSSKRNIKNHRKKNNKESCSTKSKTGQNASIQSKVFEQAISKMADTD